MRVHYVLGTTLGARDERVNKTDAKPQPPGSDSLQGPTGMHRMNE